MLTVSTATVHGHYDFFTGIITLDKYERADLPMIVSALTAVPSPVITSQTIDQREIRALVKHEVTHFLDQTTTNWGLEFLVRKCQLISAIKKGSDPTIPLQVYLLNVAELQMHDDLVRTHKAGALTSCETVQHVLKYEVRHGAVILISFCHNGDIIHDVPLSMLSLLEANAIANEYLSRLDDLTEMPAETKQAANATVERKLDKLLNDATLSEYSVIITLAKIHFDYLSVTQLLRFVSVLINFCLNASTFALVTIANVIRPTFKKVDVGAAIWADLCRGMSRHVIAFKTILLMHGWMLGSDEEKRQSHISFMKTDPCHAIKKFWNEMGMSDLLGAEEKKVSLNFCNLPEFHIASESLARNLKWSKHKNLEQCNFDEIACSDIMLGDDTVVPFPNRIDFDVLKHSNAIAKTYSQAEKLAGNGIDKFHMPPTQALAMLDMTFQLKNNPDT
ncbi:hypothetical protein ACVBEF_15825 [Glaciimonas sp. GG7]